MNLLPPRLQREPLSVFHPWTPDQTVIKKKIMSSLIASRLISRVQIFEGLVSALSFTSFVLYLLLTAGGEINWRSAVNIFLVGLVLWITGEMVFRLFKLPNTSIRIPLTLILGTVLVSLVAASGLLFKTPALTVVKVYTPLAIICFFCINRFFVNEPKEIAASDGIVDLCIPPLLFAIVASWSADVARTLPVLKTAYTLHAWTDYYIHATEISQLGSVFSAGTGSVLLAGESIPFYHYAYLGVCSILAGFVDVPPLGLATAFLTPYGIFVMVCGVYIWGALLVSRTTGILCAFLVLFLPDASTYGFKNGFFSFHWLLLTSPGTGYALGIVLTTCALFYIWRTKGSRSALFLALATTIAVLFFRVHIFLLYLPALLATMVFENQSLKQYRLGLVVMMSGLTVISIFVLLWMPPAQESWLDYSHAADFVRFVHFNQEPTGYSDLAKWITTNAPPFVAMILGVIFVPVVALGSLILIYPAMSGLSKTRSRLDCFGTFPFFLIVSFIGMILTTPSTPWGDFTEFKHRSFPLLYVVFLVWTVVFISRIGSERLKSHAVFSKLAPTIFIGAAVGVIFIGYTPPRIPTFGWGRDFYGTAVDKDLVLAALYVRERRGPTDVVALLPTEPTSALSDRGTIFASLADTPMFLARYPMQKLHSTQRAFVADERMEFLNAIDFKNHNCGSFRMLAKRGITWLVTYDMSSMANSGRFPESFRSNHVSVYDIANVLNSSCGSR